MRQAYNDFEVLIQDGVFIGVALGYDYCAEHEWGIKDLKEELGIPSNISPDCLGVDARTISKTSKDLRRVSKGGREYLYLLRQYGEERIPDCLLQGSESLTTAWSKSSLGIAMGPNLLEGKEYLDDLYEAFQNNDIVLARLGNNNPFANSSLTLLIKSRIPQEVKDSWKDADLSTLRLMEIEKTYGFKEKIKSLPYYLNGGKNPKKAGCCSPSFVANDTKIKYWVNNAGVENTYGWFTPEQIEEWQNTNMTLEEIKNRDSK